MAMSQKACRSCGDELVGPILDLGNQPLANRLIRDNQIEDFEPRFPLCLMHCRKCGLIQLSHTVDPKMLFSDYPYFSSNSEAFLKHAKMAAQSYIEEYNLDKNSFVVEIASNDGYLLKNILGNGIPCLGIEPAKNIAKKAEDEGVPTLCDFFSKKTAEKVISKYGRADLIVGNNVFAHVPEVNNFVQAVKRLLTKSGRAIFEFPWALAMMKNLEFDTIYHEHIFYFHTHPLVPLFAKHCLQIVKIEQIPIHGGSLRVHIAHKDTDSPDPSVANILAEETHEGLGTEEYYEKFRQEALDLKCKIAAEIRKIKQSGNKIAAYGASAKGSTLLNFCGIGKEAIEFVVDRNVNKQGKFTPGTRIPIMPIAELIKKMPDVTLLLTWNFAEEILSQQKDYIHCGGKFLIPLPTPHYLP